MTKARELRDLERADLVQRLEDSRKELFNLRFQLATGRLDNVTRVSYVRREIARILTIVNEESLGVPTAGVGARRRVDR